MFRVTSGKLYLEDAPFSAVNGLWTTRMYKQTHRWEDLLIDVFARSMSYAGEQEEFLCNITIENDRICIGDEEEFTTPLENGVYPVYAAKNEAGELVQIRVETFF